MPDEYTGAVVDLLSRRKGEMLNMSPVESGGDVQTTNIEYIVPTRGMIGLRNSMLTATRGTAVMDTIFDSYRPYAGKRKVCCRVKTKRGLFCPTDTKGWRKGKSGRTRVRDLLPPPREVADRAFPRDREKSPWPSIFPKCTSSKRDGIAKPFRAAPFLSDTYVDSVPLASSKKAV